MCAQPQAAELWGGWIMLRILGSPKRLCGGWSRRDFLWAGGLGLFGLGLGDFLRLNDLQAANAGRPAEAQLRSGQIVHPALPLWLAQPARDLRPQAGRPGRDPRRIQPIRSSLPGLDVGELLPHAARVMDRVTVVRSVTHPYPIHGVAYAMTGIPHIDVPMELSPRDGRHWPFIGSVVDFLGQQGKRGRRAEVPEQHRPALPLQQPACRRGAAGRPLCRLPGQRLQPGLDRVPRPGHAHLRQDACRTEKLDVAEPYMGITPDEPVRAGRRRPDGRPT